MTVQHSQFSTKPMNENGCSVLTRTRRSTEKFVEGNPFSATMAVFGLGLGIGVMLGRILSQVSAPPAPRLSETVGRRVLEALEGTLPVSVGRHLR